VPISGEKRKKSFFRALKIVMARIPRKEWLQAFLQGEKPGKKGKDDPTPARDKYSKNGQQSHP